MISTQLKKILFVLLTSAALPFILRKLIDLYDYYRIISYQLAKEDFITVLSRELSDWRTLVTTVVVAASTTYILLFHTGDIFERFKYTMSNYFSNNPLNGSQSRALLRRRQKSRSDEETLNKVMKRGGNIGGLVNDGNTCFMNSVMQSLASSNTLVSLLENEKMQDAAEAKELYFMKSLRTLIQKINAKHYNSGRDYKTNPMLKTMSKTPNKNFLLGYNQEDAQEFFQTILAELESDLKKMHKSDASDSEPSEPSTPSSTSSTTKNGPVYKNTLPEGTMFGSDDIGKLGDVYIPASQIDPNLEDANEKVFRYNLLTPVDGLSAERIGCLRCGEMGGIRYSVLSGMSLNLPATNYAALSLTDLLDEWIKPEIIEGVNCNRCALNHVIEVLEEKKNNASVTPTVAALYDKRIESIKAELKKPIIDDEAVKKMYTDNTMQKTSKSKQILMSRPPPLLAIHINRSVFDPQTFRVRKNGARVMFPLKLDLDPYVAEPSEINTDARLPLSKKSKPIEETHDGDDEYDDGEEMDVEPAEDDTTVENAAPASTSADLIVDSESETPSLVSEDDEKVEISDKVTSDPFADDAASQTDADVDLEKPQLIGNDHDSDIDESSSDDDEEDRRVGPIRLEDKTIPLSIEKQDISGPLVYQLRSVICHYGTHNYGHYIAFRKYRGVWWRTSDENVDIVDEDEVLSTPGTFMLFYELDSLSQSLATDEIETDPITTTVVSEEAQQDIQPEQQEQSDKEDDEEVNTLEQKDGEADVLPGYDEVAAEDAREQAMAVNLATL